MNALRSLKDRLRQLLGDQQPRALPRRGPKPRIGSYVIHVGTGTRLLVQAGLNDEFWKWLQEQGWRCETFRPDRRSYRDIPSSWVTRLIDAAPHEWQKLMKAAMEAAECRTALLARTVE
jgi:hypothetical protein